MSEVAIGVYEALSVTGRDTYRVGFGDLVRFRRCFEARPKSITLPLAVRANLSTSSFARFTSSAERAMPSTSHMSTGAE